MIVKIISGLHSLNNPRHSRRRIIQCCLSNHNTRFPTQLVKFNKLKYPITYQNGYEYYKVYIKNNNRAKNFKTKMEEIVEIEILSEEDFGDDWIVSQTAVLKQLIEDLTPLQIETLTQAYEGGYYNIPRNIKTEEIALKNGKSRYAVDKTIRSAENKILNYIMPFIYLQQSPVHIKPCIIEKLPLEVKV